MDTEYYIGISENGPTLVEKKEGRYNMYFSLDNQQEFVNMLRMHGLRRRFSI